MLVDVFLQHFRQFLSQRPCSQIFGVYVPVDWVVPEVLLFLVKCNRDFYFVVDVLLRAVLDPYKPQFERNLLVHNHLARVGTSVHDVDFCDDTQSPSSLRIPSPG